MEEHFDQEQLLLENEAKERPLKKSRIRMLGTKSKKFQRLIKRFDDDEDQEVDQLQEQKAKIKQKKLKKQKNQFSILQNQENIEEDNSVELQSDQQEQVKTNMKGNKEKPKVFMGDVFSQILAEQPNKNFEKNPMFSDYQKPLKKIKKEMNKEKSLRIKKKIRMLKQYIGYKKPQFDDRVKERELKISVTKGIATILNSIKQFSDEKF